MELLYLFNGIRLTDGHFPRALVDVRFSVNEIPKELATLKISISLPFNRYDESLEQTGARAIETARLLLNESEAVRWLESQPKESLPPICSPPDASDRVIPLPLQGSTEEEDS